MKKKRVFLIIIICVLAVGVNMFMVVKNQKNERIVEAQNELQYKYYLQSRFFRLGIGNPDGAKYMPYSDTYIYQVYEDLAYYKKDTGKELTIPEIQEYLSQEFEEDGNVRIYDNGKHPKIQAYIEWRIEPKRDREIENYVNNLIDILVSYTKEHYTNKGLENPMPDITELTFEQLDELIKKEADPSYEMQFDFE